MPQQIEETAPPVLEPKVITPEIQEKAGGGPMPAKTNFGDKWREAMEKSPKTPIEPPPEPTPPASKTPDEPAKSDAEPPVEPPKTEKTVEEVATKPESPLDVVVATEEKKEPRPEATDVLADLEKIEVPKSEHWKRARETMRAQADELKALKTAPKTQAPVVDEISTKRIEELQAEIADRDLRIKAINAEYSPEYQKLVGKWQGTAEKIKTRMTSFGADGDSLLAALSMPYSKARTDQIDAALTDLDAGKQGRIQSLIEELEGHAEEIGEFRKDLPKKGEELLAAQQAQAMEQQQNAIKQLETEFVKISETLPDSIVTMREVPDDVPGGTEWNKEITEARANALRVLKPDGADFNESVSIALKGARYDTLEKRYLSLHKDYRELKKSYAALDSSGPDFKGGSKPTSKVEKTRGTKYHEALAQRQAAGNPDM